MKKLLTVLSLTMFLATLAACSTVEGVGKDLKSLGGSIEKEASKDDKAK
ncbi:entericidin A/B family lipoprotein [Candidatus Thiothrix sp. Deng01]|uniref:Entericidin A/B family lipoprotein n=2 Tax=Thiothrix TaxID=1030 RepID=A0A7L6AV53_9GAMM|nr:entericidin A/B family lipoprotein [Candidatus Thiothrix sp. Deng01]MEB4593377.1 entericidin A/B family lipoprotein [Candidatus Thiothrix sp. Deng01]QLQ32963.1 MAG: entericidin A/B family lipoprotein [Candidatus Thiothrix singaporensis]